MKKLLFTTAVIIATCSAAQAVEPMSLGDRIKMRWDQRADRDYWSDPYRSASEVAPAADNRARMRGDDRMSDDKSMHKGKHRMHKMTAAEKAEWDKMTPEQRATKKAEWRAQDKARWEAKKKDRGSR